MKSKKICFFLLIPLRVVVSVVLNQTFLLNRTAFNSFKTNNDNEDDNYKDDDDDDDYVDDFDYDNDLLN